MSWLDVEKATNALASSIRHEFDPDIIIGIARGGLTPAVRLSHLLGDKPLRIIHVRFYENVNQRRGKPEMWSDVGKVSGKVLVVDDVADTGETLKMVVKHIKEKGASDVRIATIAYKPRSCVKPDFYIFETEKWIVFPWEEMPVKRRGQ